MLVTTAIEKIKSATHDISDEYSTDRCIDFLNNAIQQIASLLISAKYPGLLKEVTLIDGQDLPDNYMNCVGSYPIRITAGKVKLLDGHTSIRFRYFATPDNLTGTTGEKLPFDHNALDEAVVMVAVLLAKNENEYDITSDITMYQQLQSAIAAGMTGQNAAK